MSTTTADSSSGGFAVPAVTINSSTAYVGATVAIPSKFLGKPIIIQGVVGAGGALASLQYTEWSPAENPVLTDADFNTPTTFMFQTSYTGSNPPYQTAASGTFWFKLSVAPPQFSIYAKKASTDTTLTISGMAL